MVFILQQLYKKRTEWGVPLSCPHPKRARMFGRAKESETSWGSYKAVIEKTIVGLVRVRFLRCIGIEPRPIAMKHLDPEWRSTSNQTAIQQARSGTAKYGRSSGGVKFEEAGKNFWQVAWQTTFWTNSCTVLRYVHNANSRCDIPVTSRLTGAHEWTKVNR